MDAGSVVGWAAEALRRRWGGAVDVEQGCGPGWQRAVCGAAVHRLRRGCSRPDRGGQGVRRGRSDLAERGDAAAAERALLEWARGLGRLLAKTFGGRPELERVQTRLGLESVRPPWGGRMHAACEEAAELARSRFDLRAPAGLQQDLSFALALLAEPAREVVTPADMCPDNNLLTPAGVRFLDLESARCSSVFLEAAYARLPDGSWPAGPKADLGTAGQEPSGEAVPPAHPGARLPVGAIGAGACLALHPERRRSDAARIGADHLLARETRDASTLGWEVSRLVGLERAIGQVTFYVTFDLAFVLESSLRRLGDGDWVGNEEPASFTPYQRGPRRH